MTLVTLFYFLSVGILMLFSIFGPFIAITAGGLFNKLPVDLKGKGCKKIVWSLKFVIQVQM